MIVSEFKGKIDLNIKFGCHPSETGAILQVAKDLKLNVVGICFHVGSDCQESRAFSVAIEQARHAFDIGLQLGFCMKLLDIGGGFPGKLNTKETFSKIVMDVNNSLQSYFPPEEGVEVIAEPGRYMVASAATIGVNIISKRVVPRKLDTTNKEEVVSECKNQDDKIMYYVNDGLFGSFVYKAMVSENYNVHHFQTTENELNYESSIWGPSCSSTDCIVESTHLPLHEEGEWLYFRDMGAYTLVLATEFNGMPWPRHVYYSHGDTWYKLYRKQDLRTEF